MSPLLLFMPYLLHIRYGAELIHSEKLIPVAIAQDATKPLVGIDQEPQFARKPLVGIDQGPQDAKNS